MNYILSFRGVILEYKIRIRLISEKIYFESSNIYPNYRIDRKIKLHFNNNNLNNKKHNYKNIIVNKAINIYYQNQMHHSYKDKTVIQN